MDRPGAVARGRRSRLRHEQAAGADEGDADAGHPEQGRDLARVDAATGGLEEERPEEVQEEGDVDGPLPVSNPVRAVRYVLP